MSHKRTLALGLITVIGLAGCSSSTGTGALLGGAFGAAMGSAIW